MVPVVVGARGTQLADSVQVVGSPPGTRSIDTLLQCLAVAAFGLDGAYGHVAFEREGVVELGGAVFYVVNAGPHWCLLLGSIGGLDTGTQHRQLPATSSARSCSRMGGAAKARLASGSAGGGR